MDLRNLQIEKPKNHREFILTIILIVVVALGVLYVVGIFYKGKQQSNIIETKPKDPISVLKDLENSSKPVIPTPEERAKELNSLEKTSTKVNLTTEQKMEMLKKLSNK